MQAWNVRMPLVVCAALALVAAGCGDDDPAPKSKADASADAAAGDAADSGQDATGGDSTDGPINEEWPLPAEPDVSPKRGYDATIRWTSYGVPHITASDLGSVAYGQGYAFAKENLCTLADQIVKVRSERAKYFGPGTDDANVQSDFAYHALAVRHHAINSWNSQLTADAKDMLIGYAAGVNKRMTEAGPSGWPSECKNADWVKPVSAIDLLTYYHDIALLASGRNLKRYLAAANPPDQQTGQLMPIAPWQHSDKALPEHGFAAWSAAANALAEVGAELAPIRNHELGSNGWGLGKDRTATGGGLVIGNPHFPWWGELRLWESHLTVPGKLNVQGATLSGVPGVLIGHNEDVAFTATVSKSTKFTAYKLKLVPGNPRQYQIDDQVYAMQWHDAEVSVKQPDGSQQVQKRRFWRSHFGPIAVIGGIAEWTVESAWALRDANATNGRLLDHFLRIDMAKSVADIEKTCEEVQANPWTNTMSADRFGNAFYSESHSTPNLSPQAIAEWKQLSKPPAEGGDLYVNLAWQNGLILLDGGKGYNQWVEESGAREPGLVPFAKTPHMTRSDFVMNANDSHWLTNPAQKLTGFPFPYGGEDEQQSARTRENLRLLAEVAEGGASGADGKFTPEELQAMALSGRFWLGDVYAGQVVERCVGGPVELAAAQTVVDLSEACSVLAGWDRTQYADSKGAVLFREWYYRMGAISGDAFDPQKPESTPNTLIAKPATGPDPVLVALAEAVVDLQSAKIPLDATLRDQQYSNRGGRIAVPGGYHSEGAFNVISAPSATAGETLLANFKVPAYAFKKGPMTTEGYPVGYGTSFLMVASLTPDGPVAHAILTYSQSADPTSVHYADQTQLFSQHTFRPMLFTEAAIKADPNLLEQQVSQPAPAQ